MKTKQLSSQCRIPRASMLIAICVTILFSCSLKVLAQQRDGDETSVGANGSNAPTPRVNLNIIQLMNGEYLELFGTGTTRGILRGHPSLPGVELGSHSADPLMFSTNTLERMRILPDGRVGIGTASPAKKLHIFDNNSQIFIDRAANTAGNYALVTFATNGVHKFFFGLNADFDPNVDKLSFFDSGTPVMTFTGGKIGIGTSAPTAKLQVLGVAPGGTAVFTGTSFSSHFNWNGDNTEDTYIRGGKGTSRVIIGDTGTGNVLVALGGGNLGIGTATPTSRLHVVGAGRFTGDLTVDGNIAAKYQDVAEWVPAAEHLAAATVVVLDSTKSNQVIASNKSYDTRVAGVVSSQPGITLGEKSDEKVLVATTGRVLMNVDATNGPIQIGDLLVTSDREGFAMKSLPVETGGARLHRPGTLIGKALEPLTSGTGKILVLLSLQ